MLSLKNDYFFIIPSFSAPKSTETLILYARSYPHMGQFDLSEISDVHPLVADSHLPVRVQSLPVSSTCYQLGSLPTTLLFAGITPEIANEVAGF